MAMMIIVVGGCPLPAAAGHRQAALGAQLRTFCLHAGGGPGPSGMVSLQSRIASGVQACRTSTWPGAPWAAACPMARHRSATTGSARRQTNRMIRIGPSRACANLVAAPEISRCAQARRPVCGKNFCRLFGQRKLQFPAHQAKPRLMRGRFLARSSAQRRNAAFADFGRHVVERHMPAKDRIGHRIDHCAGAHRRPRLFGRLQQRLDSGMTAG